MRSVEMWSINNAKRNQDWMCLYEIPAKLLNDAACRAYGCGTLR